MPTEAVARRRIATILVQPEPLDPDALQRANAYEFLLYRLLAAAP